MQHDFILLDRSGSMSSLWDEALSSINAYVAKLAADNVDTGVTLATFDSDHQGLAFEIVRDRIIPRTWHPVTHKDAQPRGMTPLNDATGRIVDLAKRGNYDKVAIIIMTDGHENASRELSVTQAKAKLDECRGRNWQVIFLGANFDNAAQAQSYGAATMDFASSSVANLGQTMRATAESRTRYGATGAAMGFTTEQKEKLAA